MTIFLNLFCAIVWLAAGIIVLTSKHGVNKIDYVLCWVTLMLQLTLNCFEV